VLHRLKQLLAPIRYWKELPLRPLGDRPATTTPLASKIPPIVFQTWEDRLFGKTHLRELATFRELNPELTFLLWDRAQRDDYMRAHWGHHPVSEIYQQAQFGPMKADLFRYCLLADRGGFYFDISKGVSVPLRRFYGTDTDALITFEPHANPAPGNPATAANLLHPDKLVLQWGLGFAPGHPIPLRTIANICEAYPTYKGRTFASPKSAILAFTGPAMFTRSVHDVLAMGPLPNMAQAGIDFDGHGIFAMKGSKVRYMTAPAYTKAKDQPIVL
jgi:mannosyltransferase OCH1-like enzyme